MLRAEDISGSITRVAFPAAQWNRRRVSRSIVARPLPQSLTIASSFTLILRDPISGSRRRSLQIRDSQPRSCLRASLIGELWLPRLATEIASRDQTIIASLEPHLLKAILQVSERYCHRDLSCTGGPS